MAIAGQSMTSVGSAPRVSLAAGSTARTDAAGAAQPNGWPGDGASGRGAPLPTGQALEQEIALTALIPVVVGAGNEATLTDDLSARDRRAMVAAWRGWLAWASPRGIHPLEGTPADVAQWFAEREAAGASLDSARAAIHHYYNASGLPRPTEPQHFGTDGRALDDRARRMATADPAEKG